MVKILNARAVGTCVEGAVYVGRPSKFGNPFPMNKGRTREEAIEMFLQHLKNNPELLKAAQRELAGKDLICWCSPKSCHSEVLAHAARGKLLPETWFDKKEKDCSQGSFDF